MFHIIRSNRTEKLFEHLLKEIQHHHDPLSSHVIIVQDMGIARWLSHNIALKTGVAANIEFAVPSEFIQRVYRAWFGQQTPDQEWNHPFLTWIIFRCLPEMLTSPKYSQIKNYTADDKNMSKLYQLAKIIAAVFYRYLIYRPEILNKWEQEPSSAWSEETNKVEKLHDVAWQKALWKKIVKTASSPHQARLLEMLRDAISNDRKPAAPELIPHRIFIFGITALAPTHMDVFELLASSRHVEIEIMFYHFNPSKEYWGDVRPPEKDSQRLVLSELSRMKDFYRPDPNPLMASLAQSGRFLFDRLIEVNKSTETDLFEDPGGESMLKALQSDILNLALKTENKPLRESDQSIQVHVCHSPMREIQILHDRIAALLEEHPDWVPEDFVVMAPDINTYAPYIEAVFGTRTTPAIRWNLSERLPLQEDSLLETFMNLLRLHRWRCTASDIVSLLEVPPIARRFGLDEPLIERIRYWVIETGIRWGLDEKMRRELGLPVERANTWRMGLDRLIAGYALPPEELFYRETLSYPHVESIEATIIGSLSELIDCIVKWRKRLSEHHTPEEWRDILNELVEAFCDPAPEDEASIDRFRHALDTLASSASMAGFAGRVPIEVVELAVKDFFADSPTIKRFLTGGVTFCNLKPMRIIPFKVVWLLGMDHQAFPRSDYRPGFDIMALFPKRGDRFRSWEDRFLFLEAFLSAREVFAISYVGRDARDNSKKLPSVLVSELLDVIDKKWPPLSNNKTSSRCVIEHSLQPFSRRIYDGSDERIFSYDDVWCVDVGGRSDNVVKPFCENEITLENDEENTTIELEALVGFFRNPARWFLENSLKIALPPKEKDLEDIEPLEVEPLSKYVLTDEAIRLLLDGKEENIIKKRFRAKGILPCGYAGDIAFREIMEGANFIVQKINKLCGNSNFERVEVYLDTGEFKIHGKIPKVVGQVCLLYRPGRIRGVDYITLWIYHLALCCLERYKEPTSIFVGQDMIVKLNHLEKAGEYLNRLANLWLEGQKKPLPFFPNSSWECAEKLLNNKGKSEDFYLKAWQNSYKERGDYYDPAVRIAFRGRNPIDDHFRNLALEIFEPLIENMEREKHKEY